MTENSLNMTEHTEGVGTYIEYENGHLSFVQVKIMNLYQEWICHWSIIVGLVLLLSADSIKS